MSEEHPRVDVSPADVPLYDDQAGREEGYRAAEAHSRAYLAVEEYEGEYAITYDLLPAGAELAGPTTKELDERVTRAVEEIVGDRATPTDEVSKTISDSLGNVAPFHSERNAREVAVVIARLALDEDNWTTPSKPSGPDGDDLRRN